MTTWSQTPGNLNLAFVRGDDFSAFIDVSVNITGYTTSASIVSAVTGQSVQPLTVTVSSASAGQMLVSLNDTQTSAIPRGTYFWNLKWSAGGDTRTALTGTVEVK